MSESYSHQTKEELEYLYLSQTQLEPEESKRLLDEYTECFTQELLGKKVTQNPSFKQQLDSEDSKSILDKHLKKFPKRHITGKNNKLRNGLIFMGVFVLVGIAIAQFYGNFKCGTFPASPKLLIADLLSNRFFEQTLRGHSNSVNSVAYSPDGKYLASISDDGTIKIWELTTGKIFTLTDHSGSESSIVYSPDGKYLAADGHYENIKIWEVETGKVIRTLSQYQTGPIRLVVYSPDGKYLASANRYNHITIWEVETGKVIRKINLRIFDRPWIASVAFSSDGKYLASGSHKAIKIWEVATGQEIRTLETGRGRYLDLIVYSPNGKYLASGSRDRSIKIWEVAKGKEICTLTGHSDKVNSIAYSPDGKYLASGSRDGSIKIWRVGL
ncbi:MAG: WD40 repeat domain-containing protein [Crocosphaera sp.]